MLGDGGVTAVETHESGGFSGGSNEILAGIEDSSGGGGGGNRWPRQETLALLKIRSDMDVAFRDSSLKGPLWEEVSRKLAELGFQRSAKKCKEKFENVYKYHKRTKDGRQAKPDGKSYRFFDQLEALENTPPSIPFTPPPPLPRPQPISAPLTVTTSPMANNIPSPNPLSVAPPQTASQNSNNPVFNPTINPQPQIINAPNPNPTPDPPLSNSTSSSTSSDEDIHMRRGQKRKWKDFFDKMMKDVIYKQEEMQKKFLESLEKREKDRIAKEESWRVHEMARMNREHEILVQERTVAANKDAAVIAFLQKVTEQHNLQIPISTNAPPGHVPIQVQPPVKTPQPQQKSQPPPPPPPPQQQTPPPPAPPVASQALAITPVPEKPVDIYKINNGGSDSFNLSASSSRWPKTEVEALIKLRTDLEIKYQESGPKGPLWEEISQAMSKIGYNRSSKRCKEKWENINKYFKKVKESSKKRPEDSKTCPYFHQLDAIYSARAKTDGIVPSSFTPPGYSNQMAPIMAQPEQQWPMVNQNRPQIQDSIMRDIEGENESDDHDVYDDGDEEEEEDEGRYEIVTNKQPSSVE